MHRKFSILHSVPFQIKRTPRCRISAQNTQTHIWKWVCVFDMQSGHSRRFVTPFSDVVRPPFISSVRLHVLYYIFSDEFFRHHNHPLGSIRFCSCTRVLHIVDERHFSLTTQARRFGSASLFMFIVFSVFGGRNRVEDGFVVFKIRWFGFCSFQFF